MKITEVAAVQSGARVFAKISTDEGLVGWGEGTGFGPRAAHGLIQEIAPYLVGENPARIQQLWQEAYRRLFARSGPATGQAVAAIDLALWDLKGKTLNAPVYELLGGAARDRVRVYGHAVGLNVEEISANAKALVDAGVTVVRYRGFHDTDAIGLHDHAQAVRQQIEYTEAIRSTVGPDIDLILECHGRYDPEYALKLARQVERFDLLFLEDPIRPENAAGFRHLRSHTSVPLATGERCHDKWDFRELIQDHLVDYVRPDICWAGGITEMMKIAAFAEVYYVNVVPHNIQGPIGSAASLHTSMSIANLAVMEAALYAGKQPKDPAIGPWPVVENGYALPPTGDGLGVSVDESALPPADEPRRNHAVLHAIDGSVRDW